MAYKSPFVSSKAPAIERNACAAALAMMLTASLALAQAPLGAMYKLTEIPPLISETANCSAQGINNKGQVAGTCMTAASTQGFLYSGSTLTNLGTVGDLVGINVAGINDSGQVVGVAATSTQNPNFVFHAFLYSNGAMSDLGVPPGGRDSSAAAINNSGQIVGYAPFSSSAVPYAFLYNGGTWTNLGVFQGAQSPPGSSGAYAINNSGLVVGACQECTTPLNGDEYAFLYSNGSMTNLGTLPGGTQSAAFGINDKGQITGQTDDLDGRAFLYTNGRMKDLGVPAGGTNSAAYAVNNMGTVVGTSYQGTPGDFHAFVYAMGGITDLNKLISANYGVTLTSANAINNAGQIAATGYAGALGSPSRAYLLTPCASFEAQITTVPFGGAISNNEIQARFTQQSGLTLSALAHACGFQGFNFQQFVTSRPCPSSAAATQYPANPNLLPKANFCTNSPGGGLTAPPEFSDPPPGGYKDHPPNYDPYPYYYIYDEALGFTSLGFSDHPSDVCLYDYNLDPVTLAAQPKQCGEIVPQAGHESQSFQTALVGMIDRKTPSPPLCVFTWTSNWSGFKSNTGFVTPGPLEGSCTKAGAALESAP